MAERTIPPKILGERVARIMRGVWRTEPPPISFSQDDLESVVKVLRPDAGGLVWWRIRRSPLADSPTAGAWRQRYLEQAVHSARMKHRIVGFLNVLRAENIRSIVFKGISLIDYYAEPGLRPLGDVDLATAPAQVERAEEILSAHGAYYAEVDIHAGLEDPAHAAYVPFATWNQLWARARVKYLGQTEMHCLAPEDELQLLSIHFVRHRGIRPVWLCDIAAALEARPADFDWARCLSEPPFTSWIVYALLLSERLLGANLENTPLAGRSDSLPDWFVSNILEQWGIVQTHEKLVHESVLQLWRSPTRWRDAWRARVPDRLTAVHTYFGGLDERFLMRYQLRFLADKLTGFARRNVTDHF